VESNKDENGALFLHNQVHPGDNHRAVDKDQESPETAQLLLVKTKFTRS
jgi:hypothetical protein